VLSSRPHLWKKAGPVERPRGDDAATTLLGAAHPHSIRWSNGLNSRSTGLHDPRIRSVQEHPEPVRSRAARNVTVAEIEAEEIRVIPRREERIVSVANRTRSSLHAGIAAGHSPPAPVTYCRARDPGTAYHFEIRESVRDQRKHGLNLGPGSHCEHMFASGPGKWSFDV
jgi:hypothetical protein